MSELPRIEVTALEMGGLRFGLTVCRRLPISPATCTVLGHKPRDDREPLWAGLQLSDPGVVVRTQICGDDAPYDLHLDVPWRHPDDQGEADCIYRVRPIFERGGRLWALHQGERVRGEIIDVGMDRHGIDVTFHRAKRRG